LEDLEAKLKSVQAEADKVAGLVTSLENLEISSAEDKKKSLETLTNTMVDKYKPQISSLKGTVAKLEKEIQDIKTSSAVDKESSLAALRKDLEDTHGDAAQKLNEEISSLKKQLEDLKVSSAQEKETALTTLRDELEEHHQGEIIGLRGDHETKMHTLRQDHESELSRLRDAHQAEIDKLSANGLYDTIREMREDFQRGRDEEMQQAVEEAKAYQRSIMLGEIRANQTAYTAQVNEMQRVHQEEVTRLKAGIEAENKKVIQDAIERYKAEHAAETAAIVTRQRDEMQKKRESEMKALGDAHSSKTAALENEIAELRAALAATQAKKAPESEQKSKQLEEALMDVKKLKRELLEAKKSET
jgi:hypothetical protein